MEELRAGLKRVAESLSESIKDQATIGLGSGSTVALLLEELFKILAAKGISVIGVPTSMQIERVATKYGMTTGPMRGSLDLVVDGADQVDRKLNLIKGGGGALLKEKVLMSSSKKVAIVVSESKFAPLLCSNGVKVPVEVAPFALDSVKAKLAGLGGIPEERLLSKGYPYYTENGNIILDTGFRPIRNPAKLEARVKNLAGVLEVGIFTVRPITVYKVIAKGRFEVFDSGAD